MIDYFVPIDKKDSVKLTDIQKQQLVVSATCEWNNWTTMIQDIRDRSLEANQLYIENRPDQLDYNKPDDAAQSLSRLRRPVMAQSIDSTIAQQHQASFPMDERFFKGRPRNKVAATNMDKYERHVEARLSHVDFLVNSLKDRKNLMLDGTSLVWHPFMRRTERKTVYEFPKLLGISLPVNPIRKVKDAVTLEATAFIPINFEDWRVDPCVDSLDDAALIWRRWVCVEDLEANEAFEHTEELCSYDELWNDDSASYKREKYDQLGINKTYDKADSPLAQEMAMVCERWGDFYIDDEVYRNHVLVYANDATFLYFGPNPFDHQRKPFTVSAYTVMPGTLYGKSQAQDIIPLAHALDTLLNQVIDIISRTGNPTFTYLTSDSAVVNFFNDGPVSLVPGEGIPVKQHQSIAPIVWDRTSIGDIFGLMQQLKEEIRESTGGVPYTTGGASTEDQQRTLGEVQILAGGTNTRFQLNIGVYEEQRLKPYLDMIYGNDRQFMTEAAFVDDENEPITPSLIKQMELSFDVTGSHSIMNRSKEIQEYDFMLGNYVPTMIKEGLAKTNGDIVEFNIPEMFKRRLAMSAVGDFDNVMKVITEEELQQQAAEAQMPQQPQLGAALNGIASVVPGQPDLGMAAA